MGTLLHIVSLPPVGAWYKSYSSVSHLLGKQGGKGECNTLPQCNAKRYFLKSGFILQETHSIHFSRCNNDTLKGWEYGPEVFEVKMIFKGVTFSLQAPDYKSFTWTVMNLKGQGVSSSLLFLERWWEQVTRKYIIVPFRLQFLRLDGRTTLRSFSLIKHI